MTHDQRMSPEDAEGGARTDGERVETGTGTPVRLPLHIRVGDRFHGVAKRAKDVNRGQVATAATLLIGAGLAAKYGPRAVANLRGRNRAPIGKLSQLRFWRR